MNIEEFTQEMKRLLALLKKTGDKAKAYKLEGQLANLKFARSVSILDPLTDINSITVLDMSKLKQAIDSAEQAIEDEKARANFVEQAMILVRGAMRASGFD